MIRWIGLGLVVVAVWLVTTAVEQRAKLRHWRRIDDAVRGYKIDDALGRRREE